MPDTPGASSGASSGASRREFLRLSATTLGAALALPLAGAAAACAPRASATSSATGSPAPNTAGANAANAASAAPAPGARVPGIQLYTVRSLMERDVEGTLTALAGMGYKELEFAGYFGRDPRALRRTLDGLGVTAPSAHIPLDVLRGSLGSALDAAAVVGHQYIVCPYVPEEQRTPDGYRRIVDDLARIGPEVKARGMQLAYHNHDFEFKPLPDGRLPYDLLLSGTDRSAVQMELDLYWITYAGKDPLAYITADPGRFPLCHVKDLSRAGGAAHMADVGQGSIDFRGIFARAQFRHYFVERDDTKDPLASARISVQALRTLLA